MSRRRTLLVAVSIALATAAAGCGFGDKPELPPVLPEELQVGSSEPGGGDIGVLYDFAAPVALSRSAVLGSFVLYTAIDPSFDGLVEAKPNAPLYPFPGEVSLVLEVIAVDPGAELRIGDVVLGAAGDQAVISVAPGSHLHPEWRVTAPEGTTPEPHRFTFRLSDPEGFFGATETYELSLVVVDP